MLPRELAMSTEEPTVTVAGRVPRRYHRALKYLAFGHDTSLSGLVAYYTVRGMEADGAIDADGNLLITIPDDIARMPDPQA